MKKNVETIFQYESKTRSFTNLLTSPRIYYYYDTHSNLVTHIYVSYDVASGSEITPCNKICKPLVVYRFSGNVMMSITTLRT